MLQQIFMGRIACDCIYVHFPGFLMYYSNRLKYGACDFSKTQTTGIYNVGYSRFAAEKGNFCAIYYPIDKHIGHKSQKREDVYNNEPLIPSRLTEIAKNLTWAKKDCYNHATFLLPPLNVSIPVFVDANLAPEFMARKETESHSTEGTEVKSLVPVIFSHEILNRALDYTYFCRELASHGLLVVALDHLDGSG